MYSYSMDESQKIRIAFCTEPTARPEMSDHIELFHVISGEMHLRAGNEDVVLPEDGIYLLNPGSVYEIAARDGTIYARTTIGLSPLLELLGKGNATFFNIWEQQDDAAYSRLEALLWRSYEVTLGENEGAKIQYLSQYYQLIEVLSKAFLQKETEKNSGDNSEVRDSQILQFIRSHYTEQITLDMLAKELFLSNAYLSKYIKRRFQANYLELVNQVRLQHAVDMLKYSGESVTRVAMANGFSSVAAFNKTFREIHGITPSEYRQSYHSSMGETGEGEKKELPAPMRRVIFTHLEAFKRREREAVSVVRMECEIDGASSRIQPLRRSWQRVINVGTAYDLTRSDYQQQLLYLKDKIGFEYVRFWDVFSTELRINIHEDPKNANFGALFRIVEFLIDHNMKPFFELAFKPIRVLRSPKDAILDDHRKDVFRSPEELHNFVAEFTRQLAARYGTREASSWYFEYWKTDPLMFYVDQKEQKNFSEPNSRYFEEFDALASGIRSALPFAKIGGGGFTFRTYGEAGMAEILDRWKLGHCLPDFLSLNCFQYRNVYLDNGDFVQERYEDADYISQSVQALRRIMRARQFPEKKIFVTEFDFSVSNRSVMNDSCSKAAQLLQAIFATVDHTDIMAYWTALDAYAEHSDTRAIIFGGVGLLTKDGIPKPSFFAYEFLNRLDDEVLEKNRDFIITRQGPDSFKVLCHNFRGYAPSYYAQNENRIDVREFASLSADEREKHIRLKLTDIPNGTYQIRLREVNRQVGAIQGIWRQLNYDTRLNRDDIAFIRQMCVPGMRRIDIEVVNGELEFELRLPPNAIKYAHFIRRDS